MKKTLSMLLVGWMVACGSGDSGDNGENGNNGSDGQQGQKGDKGDPGQVDPAVGLLTPATLFAGRTALVQIGGVATHFADGSTVDFGDPGIKVMSVQAGSNANLRVTVSVGIDARLGAHDVQVSTPPQPTATDPEVVLLKGGFMVNPSLAMALTGGAMAPAKVNQGGITDVSVLNLDARDNPFNTGMPPQFASGVLMLNNPTLTEGQLTGTGLVDALAPTGSLKVALTQKDRLGQDIGFVSDPADKLAPQVVARAASALTAGMGKTGEVIDSPRATNLYKITTAMDNQIAHIAFTGLGSTLTGTMGRPPAVTLVGYNAPGTGRFREGRGLDTSETAGMMPNTVAARNSLMMLPKAGDYYFVVYTSDLSGGMNTSYTVTARWAGGTSLGSLKEPMMADTPAMPMATIMSLDKPYYAVDGAVDTLYDEDYVKFTATKTGRVYVGVTTTAGVSMGVGLRQGDCTTVLAASRYTTSGTVLNEADVVSGTAYCVRIAGNGQLTNYQFMITQALN